MTYIGYPLQAQFASHIKAMVAALEEWVNPFSADIQGLVVLGSKEVMGAKAVSTLREVEAIGQSQYETYVDKRRKQLSILISNIIIPKNKIIIWRKFHKTNNPEQLMK